MWEFLERLFGAGFMPHGHCYLWTPALVWAQVTSNTFIGVAYLSISATLGYLVRRVRLPFSWVYVAFGVFILACGLTHFLDVVTVWHPIYWADAGVRTVTAIASLGTAVLVFPLVPKVLALSRISELARERGEKLETAVLELTEANDRIEREQATRERLAAENAKMSETLRVREFQETFLAVLGHDLRNPLASIEMGTGLLRRTAGERERQTLERMDASATRMSRMIGQILDLTRTRLGGGIAIQRTQVDLGATLLAVVDELRSPNPGREIILRCPAGAIGSWDRDRLEQVFSNVIENAIHYGAPSSPVTVDVSVDDAQATVTVHNHGGPIPEELRGKLFDPFRRGTRDSRSSKTAGLGLGLFISHEIVRAHGGSVDVASNEAEGTTVRVTLPREGDR